MSEIEKLKRLAYKQNRKRCIIVQSVIAIVLFIAILLSCFLYYRLNQTYYIDYTEKADLNYKVYLKENNFYEEEYLEGGKEYVASLIDSVTADLKYELNIDADGVEYEYSYGIDAHLLIVGKDTGVTVLDRTYPIKDKVVVTDTRDRVEINESFIIDYDEYNSFAKKFFADLNLNSDRFKNTLAVTMTVNVKGASEALIADTNNNYKISLNIPLTLDTVEIDIGTSVPTEENKVLACKNAVNTSLFRNFAIGGSIFEIVLIAILIAFILITRNDDINYNIKVKRIVNSYKSFIQKINNEFDTSGYQLLIVDTFNDMLAIRDTIQSPVLMNENEDQTLTRFLIPTNTKILYVYEIKVDNYDSIYGSTETEAAQETAPEETLVEQSVCDTSADEKNSETKIIQKKEPASAEESSENEESTSTTAADKQFTLVSDIVESVDSDSESDDEDDSTALSCVDNTGRLINIRCSRSFTANLIQANETIKSYYTSLKNYILSYKGVKSRTSWRLESFRKGRNQLFKLKIRGKTVILYCALDPKEFDTSKYFHKENTSKTFAAVPMIVRIKSDRGLKRTKQLIDLVMQKFEIPKDPKAIDVDYAAEHPYESTKALVEKNLIKLLFPADSDFSNDKKESKEEVEKPEVLLVDEADIDKDALAVAMSEPTVELEDISYIEVGDDIEEIEPEPEESVEVIGVVWPEHKNKNKIYRYDPNGEKLDAGDIVLVPTKDVARNKDVIRKAAVAHSNHRVPANTVTSPLKKIIGIVKRKIEDALTPDINNSKRKKK